MGSYRERSPQPVLQPYVECIWSQVDAGRDEVRVVPDGCVDVLLEIGARPEAFFVGAMTQALVVPPQRHRRIVAVRFRPGGAAAFLPGLVRTLTDALVPLAELWPDAATLSERAAEASTMDGAGDVLEAALRLRLDATRSDPRLVRAVTAIGLAPHHVSVARLASTLGMSRQWLTQTFSEAVGLGPKMLGRVLRLRGLDAALRATHGRSWARLAADHGYADQAHLANDVKALVGLTPTAWRATLIR